MMQIVVYKYANNQLFLRDIIEDKGEGIIIKFPESIGGICHIGKAKYDIKNGCVCLNTKTLARGTYPVYVESEGRKVSCSTLYFADGKIRSESSQELLDIHYEIALLKENAHTISEDVKRLCDAVFRTVIF